MKHNGKRFLCTLKKYLMIGAVGLFKAPLETFALGLNYTKTNTNKASLVFMGMYLPIFLSKEVFSWIYKLNTDPDVTVVQLALSSLLAVVCIAITAVIFKTVCEWQW